MLTHAEIVTAAVALDEAERQRVQTGLLSLRHPDMDMDDAYAIQNAWVGKKKANGRTVIGWKIGLTSKAMQGPVANIIRARDYPPSILIFMLF